MSVRASLGCRRLMLYCGPVCDESAAEGDVYMQMRRYPLNFLIQGVGLFTVQLR